LQAFAFRLNGQGEAGVSAALKALAVQRKTGDGVKAMTVSLLGQCLRSCGNFKLAFSVMSTMRQPAIDPNGDHLTLYHSMPAVSLTRLFLQSSSY
jgi:hypothetical protein